jgi:hypothetical protein
MQTINGLLDRAAFSSETSSKVAATGNSLAGTKAKRPAGGRPFSICRQFR